MVQIVATATVVTAGCDLQVAHRPPLSPEAALSTFTLEPGFRIDLVAAEPLVMDPVAMDIDEHGRIFVVEMPGYPLDSGGSGRVKLLQDTDGDGMPDAATVYADGLRLPTGIMRWRDGVIVTDPPEVLFLADTTGDGVADVRRVMLTGFALSNAQHNANTPVYGLDNWIYIANNGPISWTEKFADPFGDLGSAIRFPDSLGGPRLPRNGADRNVRFRPYTFELENLSSRSQFGQTFDAWGRHFLVNNSRHHMHEVIPARFFGQNGATAVVSARHSTSDHGNAAQVFPLTVDPEHQLLTDRGVFTSACGITFYKGGLFPAVYDSVTFVAEPVHNLVHADLVQPDGPTFVARRMAEGREFLASTDSWFRPVSFSQGPDGALYVVDYYRQIVEHPEWMDDSLAAHGNLTRGTSMGRIWRIVPDDADSLDWYGALPALNTSTLVSRLSSPNAWWRMTAQRLLIDRKDSAATVRLRAVADSSRYALARLHALWTLSGTGAVTQADLKAALGDAAPGVRESAVRLAELYPALEADLVALADDLDPRVRFEVLGALRRFNSMRARQAQFAILWRDVGSIWVQSLALLVTRTPPQDMLWRIMRQSALPESGRGQLMERASALIAAEASAEGLWTILGAYLDEAPILRGIAQGLQHRAGPLGAPASERRALVSRVLGDHPEAIADASLSVLAHLGLAADSASVERAHSLLMNRQASVLVRARAARLLGLAKVHGVALAEVAASKDSTEVRMQALQALSSAPGLAPAHVILAAWPALTPHLRQSALAIFTTQERAAVLVDAMEAGRVVPAEIPWQYRVRLMRDTEEPVRSRARALLQLPLSSVRGRRVPTMPGRPDRGRELFLTRCAACHRAGPVGDGQAGPDLTTVRHWSQKALIDKMADPSRQVASGYEQWIIEQADGAILQGVVIAETPVSVTLATPDASYTLPQEAIATMRVASESLMPGGLMDGLSEAELADLLAFVLGR